MTKHIYTLRIIMCLFLCLLLGFSNLKSQDRARMPKIYFGEDSLQLSPKYLDTFGIYTSLVIDKIKEKGWDKVDNTVVKIMIHNYIDSMSFEKNKSIELERNLYCIDIMKNASTLLKSKNIMYEMDYSGPVKQGEWINSLSMRMTWIPLEQYPVKSITDFLSNCIDTVFFDRDDIVLSKKVEQDFKVIQNSLYNYYKKLKNHDRRKIILKYYASQEEPLTRKEHLMRLTDVLELFNKFNRDSSIRIKPDYSVEYISAPSGSKKSFIKLVYHK